MQKVLDFYKNGIHYHVFRFNGSSASDASTVKDVGAYETIEHAEKQGANVAVNVTEGNNGHALKNAAYEYNQNRPLEERIKVVHIIGIDKPGLRDGLSDAIRDYSTGQSEMDFFHYSVPIQFPALNTRWLTPEDRVSLAREYLEKNPSPNFRIKGVVDVTHYIPTEYLKQAEEILQQKVNGRYLDWLGIPVGTGRGHSAFDTALDNLRRRGFDIHTKLVGIVPKGENPIYHRFVFPRKKADGTLEYVIEGYNPKPKTRRRGRADKLSCPYTDLLPQLMQAKENGHPFIEIDSKAIERANTNAFMRDRKHNKNDNPLSLEDSASVGFVLEDSGLVKKLGIKPSDNVGIFITGRGLYATPSWEEKENDNLRRREKIYSALSKAARIAAVLSIFSIPVIFGPTEREQELSRQLSNIYTQKVEFLQQIRDRDSSLQRAIEEIEDKNNLIEIQRHSSLKYPYFIIDEIIGRYLELNKDKIQGAKDPRDREPFERLKSLILESDSIRERPREPVK